MRARRGCRAASSALRASDGVLIRPARRVPHLARDGVIRACSRVHREWWHLRIARASARPPSPRPRPASAPQAAGT
eukprot:6205552-Pleurochrysis_carterae.AAC.7